MKIADFGVSKRTKGTILRTQLGSQGYIAPELIGLLSRRYRSDNYSKAVDMWALGCLVHELLTGQLPFREIEYEPDWTIESGIGSNEFPEPQTDFNAMKSFCDGKTDLPTDLLKQSRVSEIAIRFLQLILVAKPESRQSAKDALESAWLICEDELGINISREDPRTNTNQGDVVINSRQQAELPVTPVKRETDSPPRTRPNV